MSDIEQESSAHHKSLQQDFEEEMQEPEDVEEEEENEEEAENIEQAEDGKEEEPAFPLPAHGITYAIIAGIIAGGLGVLLNLALTFLNAPLFRQAAQAGNSIAYDTALAIVGIQCLNFLLSVFVCYLAGYFVAKMAVQRRLGFYAGAIAGVIMYVVSLVVHYIPGYPGDMPANSPTDTGGTTAGVITIVVFLFVWCFIGGLLSLWGAWMATRHHPYYAAQEE